MAEPQVVAAEPRVARELKRDGLGRIEYLERAGEACARRVACGGRVPLSGALARVLLRRERRALDVLRGTPGVPRPVADADLARLPSPDGRRPRANETLLRTWLEGQPLSAADVLPSDFFERLEELVRGLHARGVCHNDLHKEQNVLVLADGYPGLIDFQLASVHRRAGRVFHSRAADDLRHVWKHRRRYQLRGDGSRAAKRRAGELPARSRPARLWRRGGKPLYHWITRRLLRRGHSEARRPSAGPWPAAAPPVGPRAARRG